MPISKFDIQNMDEIIHGHGDWFTAKLLRLMSDSDMDNLARLGSAYPEELVEFCKWKWQGVPMRFVTVDAVHTLVQYQQNIAATVNEYPHWLSPEGKAVEVNITHGRDM